MKQRALPSPPPSPRWLTLSQAAEILGVHATTLRRWADDGQIRCLRTPGGHRRFVEADLRAFLQARMGSVGPGASKELERTLVLQTRQEMASTSSAETAWRSAFDEAERAARRVSGRRLVGLAIQFTSRSTGREVILEEGRRIGRQYGRDAAERGLPLVDTTRAFLFFREALIRSARPGLSTSGEYDAEDVHIHRSLREFLDQVFFAAMAAYEEHPAPSLPRARGAK
jgi:excisionase family DNA binding protein